MRSSSSRLLRLAAAATSGACCLALVLAVGVCTASCGGTSGGGLVAHGRRVLQPRPPSSPPVLAVDSLLSAPAPALQEKGAFAAGEAAAARDLLGAAAGQDYGFVDPPPDTRRRGGTAPIPHS